MYNKRSITPDKANVQSNGTKTKVNLTLSSSIKGVLTIIDDKIMKSPLNEDNVIPVKYKYNSTNDQITRSRQVATMVPM